MNRAVLAALLLCGIEAKTLSGDGRTPVSAVEGLQPFNDFVGVWNGVGGPDKPRPDPGDPVWKETIEWQWRFRGGDAWLSFTVRDGKHVAGGEVRYRPDTRDYVLRLTSAAQHTAEYVGRRDKDYYIFERVNAGGDVHQITMHTAAEGVRFIYRAAMKPAGRTLFTRQYQVAASRAGESLAGGGRKNECVVTGGLGTIAVSYKGETYWVCCTGCRDAFNEDPEKYIREFKSKKAKP
jgi:hypothetical protein